MRLLMCQGMGTKGVMKVTKSTPVAAQKASSGVVPNNHEHKPTPPGIKVGRRESFLQGCVLASTLGVANLRVSNRSN